MNPRVSVLMSVYNNEKSVGESINSIVCQTFSDWELILLNDASTDGSLKVIEDWARRDNRIRVYSNPLNLGLAASLNEALKNARGEYIARMDGDDVSFPQRFEKQVSFLDSNKEYSIVGSSCVLFDAKGEWGKRISLEKPQKKDFLWGSRFNHPSTIMRREALLSVGGYRVSRETLRTEDYDLFMRMYAKGYFGYNFNEPLIHYFEPRDPKPVKLRYRINEVRIRYSGFKAMGLLPAGLPFIFKPVAVGLLPGRLKRFLQRKRGGHSLVNPNG